MRPQLAVPKTKLKTFSISRIKDFEGCPDAYIYLHRKYKNKVDDLTKYRSALDKLINNGKALWVINFCLNLVTRESRHKFLYKHIERNIGRIKCEKTKAKILTDFLYPAPQSEITGLQQILEDRLDFVRMQTKVQQPETVDDLVLISEIKFLEGLIYLHINTGTKLTTEGVKFLHYMFDSSRYACLATPDKLVEDQEFYARDIIDYVGIFED